MKHHSNHYATKREGKNKIKVPRVYTLTDGQSFSTINRNVSQVTDATKVIPTDDQVFDIKTGLPNHEFIKNHFIKQGKLTNSQVIKILNLTINSLSKEPNLLSLDSPVTICGDIHGQFYDLVKLFEVGGQPENTSYLFLGDYVDRGCFSIECLVYLYSLKQNFKNNIWLLRGNHECRYLTTYFTFKNECLHKYNLEIYEKCCSSFNTLPLAAVINNRYFCVHGGISPNLKSTNDINKINRFREIPSSGLMCDLLWADPVENYDDDNTVDEKGKPEKFILNTLRGCSYAFTYKASCDFLSKNKLLTIIRAHEAQDEGYRMYKNTEPLGFPSLLTIFSAPNYLDTYKNKAAILMYESDEINIRQFQVSPHPYYLPDFGNAFDWSLPYTSKKIAELLESILNICSKEELKRAESAKFVTDSSLGKAIKINKTIHKSGTQTQTQNAEYLGDGLSLEGKEVALKSSISQKDFASIVSLDDNLDITREFESHLTFGEEEEAKASKADEKKKDDDFDDEINEAISIDWDDFNNNFSLYSSDSAGSVHLVH